MKIAGIDIGGANTDCSIVEIKNNKIISTNSSFKYLPMWKKKEELSKSLLELINDNKIDAISISMTAELADRYKTKQEGVIDIANRVIDTFKTIPIRFVTFDGILTYDELLKNPLKAAAANWIGTTSIIKFIKENCIFIDMGSTTTDIIPIINGKQKAKGHTDLERLCTGELVYTGMLRTNVATIVNKLPINKTYVSVSSELFALSADVHLLLNNIEYNDYSCDTVDGNNKDKISCMRRLSRVICSDLESINQEDILKIANYIYEKQIQQVMFGLEKVIKENNIEFVVTTGLGMNSVCKKASENLNLNVITMDSYFSKEDCVNAPAIGAAYMLYLDFKKNNKIR